MIDQEKNSDTDATNKEEGATGGPATDQSADKKMPTEIGGQKGPEPTRYGDWEKGGIISDF